MKKAQKLPKLEDGDVMIAWGGDGHVRSLIIRKLKTGKEYDVLCKKAEYGIFQ